MGCFRLFDKLQVDYNSGKQPLLFDHEIITAILGPRIFVMTEQQRSFLAIGNGIQPVFGNAEIDQIFFGAHCPPLSQCHIIFIGPSFVAVSFNADPYGFVVGQEFGILLNSIPLILANIGFVKIKIDRQERRIRSPFQDGIHFFHYLGLRLKRFRLGSV